MTQARLQLFGGREMLTLIKAAGQRNRGQWDWCTGAFAYVSAKGAALLEATLQDSCADWGKMDKRFMASLDFGHSEPGGIRYLKDVPGAAVRIPAKSNVLKSTTLQPSPAFHPKILVLGSGARSAPTRVVAVVGSANLTAAALHRNCEAAVILEWDRHHSPASDWKALLENLAKVWRSAENISDAEIDLYARRRGRRRDWKSEAAEPGTGSSEFTHRVPFPPEFITALRKHRYLWIDPDPITKNLGRTREGNQFDSKAGTRVFFGARPERVGKNTTVCTVTIVHVGGALKRTIRYGNNSMDKISLPAPTDANVTTYVGSTLLFERVAKDRFKLTIGAAPERAAWRAQSVKQGVVFKIGSKREFGVY